MPLILLLANKLLLWSLRVKGKLQQAVSPDRPDSGKKIVLSAVVVAAAAADGAAACAHSLVVFLARFFLAE